MALPATRLGNSGGVTSSSELELIDTWWRTGELPRGGPDLPPRQPAPPGTAPGRAHQTEAARALGHHPGLNLLYAHLNRVIRANDLDVIFVCGPGHGGPAVVASTYLEGTYTELFPHITRDEEGLHKLFRQFSFPGGIPSHAAATTPGSINEGGELGYSLVHAYGAVFDNPDLIAACVIGDGEAETGALATSWHSNKFLDPVARRRGPSDPASQRVEDRQPDGAGAHPRRGPALVARGLRARGARGCGRRAGSGASATRRHPRHGHRTHPRHPARRARGARRHRICRAGR